MAKKYVDKALYKDETYYIKDSELRDTVSTMSTDISVLNDGVTSLGGQVTDLKKKVEGLPDNPGSAGTIRNVYDGKDYRVWVGSEEAYAKADKKDDVIYFVGEGFDPGTNPNQDEYQVTLDLVHCDFNKAVSRYIQPGETFSNTLVLDEGYTLSSIEITVNTVNRNDAFNPDDNSVTIDNVDGPVSIKAVAIKALTGITIKSVYPGVRPVLSNTYNLLAELTPYLPADDINAKLAWKFGSDTNTDHFKLDAGGRNATVTVLSGASSEPVTVICYSTYYMENNVPTISAEKTFPNVSYIGGNINVIDDSKIVTPEYMPGPDEPSDDDGIYAGRAKVVDGNNETSIANTIQLATIHNGVEQDNVEYSVTCPNVRSVDLEGNETTLPAVTVDEADSSRLKFKVPCEITVTCTVGGATYSKSFQIERQDYDNIWFEDSRVKKYLINGINSLSAKTEITYSDAYSAANNSSTNDKNILAGKKDIKYFNEWQYFKKAQFYVKNCSNLASVVLPVRVDSKGEPISVFTGIFGLYNTALTSLDIPEGYTEYKITDNTTDGIPTGNFTSINFPSSMQSIATSLGLTYSVDGQIVARLGSVTELDLSNTRITELCERAFQNMNELTTVKFPNSFTFIKNSRTFKDCSKLSRVEFGTGFTGINANANGNLYGFIAGSGSKTEVTYVFHSNTPPTAFNFTDRPVKKILVPSGSIDDYKAAFAEYNVADKIEAIQSTNNYGLSS